MWYDKHVMETRTALCNYLTITRLSGHIRPSYGNPSLCAWGPFCSLCSCMGLAPYPQSKLTGGGTKVRMVLQLFDLLQLLCAALTVLDLLLGRYETQGIADNR